MAAPKGTDHVWNPQGSTFTCELQGFFFFTFHLMVPLYNASLCIFYMLVVKYSIADDIMAKRYEPYLHAGPICWALLIGSIILAMDSFNAGEPCYINAHPKGCELDESVECTRGKHLMLLRYILHLPTLLVALFIMVTTLLITYASVLEQERKSERYRVQIPLNQSPRRESWRELRSRMTNDEGHSSPAPISNQDQSSRRMARVKRSRLIMNQAISYVCAYLLVFMFPTIFFITQTEGAPEQSVFIVFAIAQILFPLQGFFNLLIYLQPKMARLRRENQNLGYLSAFWLASKPEGPVSPRARRTFRNTRLSNQSQRTLFSGWFELRQASQTHLQRQDEKNEIEIQQESDEEGVRSILSTLHEETHQSITSRQPGESKRDDLSQLHVNNSSQRERQDIPSQLVEDETILFRSGGEQASGFNANQDTRIAGQDTLEKLMENNPEESGEEKDYGG